MVLLSDWYHDLTTSASMPSLFTRWRSQFWLGLLFLVFALWLPLRQGTAFLDPVSLGAYAAIGVVFAAPLAASSGETIRPTLTGLGIAWVMLITGVAIVYTTRNVVAGVYFPSLAACGLFGATLTGAVSSVAAYFRSLTLARLILFGLLALFYFKSRWLPDVALQGSAILAGVWLAFFWLLRRRRDA